LFYSFFASDYERSLWVYSRLLQSVVAYLISPGWDVLLNAKALYNEYTIFPFCGGCRCCCLVIDIAQPENMRPIEERKAGWLSPLSDRQEMACSRAVAQRHGLKEIKVRLMLPAGVIKPPATAERQDIPVLSRACF